MTDVFSGLFPLVGPWTQRALWHDVVELPLPDTAIEPELTSIVSQRLAPLLLRCLRRHDPSSLAGARATIEGDAFLRASLSRLVLERGAAICGRLEEIGIPVTVAKGPSIAAAYPSWQDRPFSDLDLYVDPELFAEALQRCESWGLLESFTGRQPRRFADAICREAINLKATDGTSVDLHHHVPPWFWGRGLAATDLLAGSEVRDLLGHSLRCVTAEDNLLIAALHVVSDKNTPGATLMIWRDLVQLASVVDVERVAAKAEASGLSWWLQRVLEELPAQVRPQRLLATVASLHGAPIGRRRLELMLSQRSRSLGVGVTQPLRLPVGRAVLFGAALAAPSQEFLRQSFPGDPHPRRTWWREAVGRRRTDGSRVAA